MKDVTVKLPDWVYKYFEDKWPKSKYEEDRSFNLEWYISWKISEIVGNEMQKEILAANEKKPAEVKSEKEIGMKPKTIKLP